MNKFFKRLALLLAVLMIVSMMPVQLFADNGVTGEEQSNGTSENGTGENSYLTISGIAGFEDTQFASFADAYAAIKLVLEGLCADDALGQGVATAGAFDDLFTNRDKKGNATLTYTISGNIVYDETGYANLLTMGRRASHYGNDRHLINFKFVGATGKEADTLTVNSNITLPYEWWGEKTVTSISFENLTITGSAPNGLYPYQSYFEGINFKVDNCNLKGIKIYNCSNVKGTYTITNSTLDGTGAPADAYAIHLQGHETEPLTININGNTIRGYDRGINIDQKTANATISGNTISIKDAGRSCIQLSSLKSTVISNNTLELTGGNAITLHENLLTLTATPEITVEGNTITGNGYLIYDGAAAKSNEFTSENLKLTIGTNTVASTVDTTQGVKGSKKSGLSETVATVVNKALTPAYVATVNGVGYTSLAEAIAAAPRKATVKLLADTKENVTISTPYVTLDLNGHTINGGTEKGKPALTITARVTVMDSSEAQTGTIMREDTAENSGVSSHYVIDIQGSGWLTFESGTVKNDSGSAAGKGASLVRVGNDSVAKYPGLNIKGGTFTQDNFIVIKVDRGDLFLNGGTLNSASSYAVENWHRATIKGGTVNGTAAAWTYSGGLNSTLEISGGTINGNVKSVSYDGAEGKVAKVEITGGTVNGELGTYTYSNGLTATEDATKATIGITGGTFTKDPTKYVIEDSAITKNADGTFGVAKAYLAEVDGNKYYTMDEAFHAAVAAGSTLKLLRNYTTASSQHSGSKSFTIDLNGFTWTYTSTDFDCAAFEINYPNVTLTVKNGTVVSASMAGLIPSAMSGTITYDNSGLIFDGVEITANGNSGIQTNGNNTNDTVTLKNSTLNVPNGFGIYFPSSGKLTLDNSTVNAKTMGVQVCAGSLSINEGSAVTVTGDAVPKAENDGAIQDGAAISIVNRTGYKGLDTVTVSGGKFTAKEGNSAIKAYDWANKTESDFTASEKVAVSGGTFSSEVKEDLCADGFIPTQNADGTYGVKTGKYVAQIGDVKYETLADALAAAKDGETVKLLDNVDLTETLIIKDKTITLDLNGKTISNSTDIWNESIYAWSLISVRDNGDLTIDDTVGGGTLKAKENDCFTLDVYAYDTKNVENTKLTINAGNYVGNISAVYAFTGKVTINGGHFSIQQKESGSDPYRLTLNCYDSSYTAGRAGFTVNGGTFENFDPRNNTAEGEGTSFVAEGVGINKDENGNFTANSGMAAQIVDADGNSVAAYATLADAIAAANAGETVKLLADVTADVVINKNITLDLGGKTLTNTGAGKATISVTGGTVTVKNGTVIGGASYYNIEVTNGSNANLTLEDVTATAGNIGSSMIDNWGTMTIKSGTYTGGMNTVKSEEGSTLVINGGKFELNYAVSNKYNGVILSAGITTISGGEFIQNATTPRWGNPQVVLAMQVDGYTSKIEITGGTFTNKKSGSNIFHGVGKATSDNFEVSGGTFNKSISDSYCAEGFIPTKNADGTYGVKEGKYVAKVGSTGYETLDEAIAAANKSSNSKTIKLLENLTVDHQIVINNVKDKAITLDLGGKTLTSTLDFNGYSLRTETKVTIKNGTYKGTGTARGIGAYADFVLDGVTVDVAGLVGVACSTGGKTYAIKNSVVKAGYAVCNFADNATITISDSTLTGTGNVLYHNGSNYGLKLTVTNSTIIGTSDDCCGVYISGSTSAQANSENQNGAGGYQQATFTKCTISGTNGIEVKYTDLTLDGCTVISTSNVAPSYTQNNNGPAASGFAVVSTDNATQGNTPKPEGTIIVKGEGKYTGPVGLGSLESVKTSYAGFNDETIKVSDGTFSSAVPEEYCAEGFIPTKNADGTYGVKAGKYVAKIGDVKYETLEEAFAAAKNGDTITLLQDCKSDRINLEDKSVTVVLNGKTLTSTAAYGVMFCAKNGNKITIDGTVEGSKLVGTLMITSGTDGHIEVNGGTYESSQYCPIYVNGAVSSENSTVTVKNAIIKATNISSDQDMGCGVYLAGYSTSVFENCTITAPITGIEIRAGKLTLNNCNVTGGNGEVTEDANGNGTTVTNAALAISQHTTKKPIEVTIDGGTFNGTAAVYQTDVQGTGSADVKIAVKSGTFNGTISGETDGTIAISGGKFKVKVDDKYFDGDYACSTDMTDGYYTVAGHPIISAGLTISVDMSFRVKVRSGYKNGSLRYYYDTIGENNTIVRVEGEGILGATDAEGNSIFRIYNVNPQRADLVYTFQYYDAEGNAVGTPKQRSVIAYFEDFYNLPLGDKEDLNAKKTFIANFLEYCASAMERSYYLHKDVTLNGKTWQDRADAVREMMTRLGLVATNYEFKGNLGRYYKDNSEGIILKRGVVFGSTFKAYYQISKEAIDDNGYRVFRQGMDVTDKLELVDGAYRLYFELAPYEFKDNLTITVNNGTTKVCEYTSPLANTLEVLSKSTDASLAKMAKAAFNYFVALQNYNG